MTLQRIYVKEYGKEAYRKLHPRVKRLLRKIDATNAGFPPVSSKQLREALR